MYNVVAPVLAEDNSYWWLVEAVFIFLAQFLMLQSQNHANTAYSRVCLFENVRFVPILFIF